MRSTFLRALGRTGALVLAAGLWVPLAQAQDYPTKPLRIVVPFSPGGAVDGPMRAIAEQLGKRLKQQVIIENRPGAGATIGSDLVAKAPPDGYTLLLASQTNAISATLYGGKLAFNPIDDFVGISLLGREPGVLVVHPSLPVNNVAELVALAKKDPGKLNYASSGNGSGQHLFMAMFASMSGIQLTHVPYKGSGQAVTDLLAGTVPMAIPGTAAMVKHIRSGKLRPLATSGSARSAQLPEVPTLAETGVGDPGTFTWFGLMAPAGTPRGVVNKLNAQITAAMQTPAMREQNQTMAMRTRAQTPEEFAAFLKKDREVWGELVRQTGIQLD